MFKKLLVGLSIVLSSAASAEIFEAWDFSAIEGDAQQNIALFDSAKVIQEKAGAHVEYWQHDVNGENVIAYVIRFKDLASWAKWKDDMSANEDWLNWSAKEWPKARPHLVASYAMNNLLNPEADVDLTEGMNVMYMSAWEASDDSNNMKLFASIQKSVKISEDFGISSQVYVNGPSGIFYIFNMGESFVDLTSKLEKRNTSKEWQEYWSNAQTQRAGQFVRQAWITRVANN
ncbi:MAG: hypothetical protein HOF19_15070 [Gammaproteobacteria bacterium]|jgi:hypothetical protein|nr:hypothetical protein [Gammaproteobacteria bacterium]